MALYEIELDDEDEAIINDEIAAGRYNTPAEVLRAGLDSFRQELPVDAGWLDRLRSAAKVGFDQIDRGEYITLESEADIHAFMDGIRAKVKARRETSTGG